MPHPPFLPFSSSFCFYLSILSDTPLGGSSNHVWGKSVAAVNRRTHRTQSRQGEPTTSVGDAQEKLTIVRGEWPLFPGWVLDLIPYVVHENQPGWPVLIVYWPPMSTLGLLTFIVLWRRGGAKNERNIRDTGEENPCQGLPLARQHWSAA